MRIKRIKIVNFRNFEYFEVNLETQYLVIVGENNAGKTNLIHAIRLVLDNSLPDSERYLNESDFWDGLSAPFAGNEIKITLEFADFENDSAEMASLRDCFKHKANLLTSAISFVFIPRMGTVTPNIDELTKDDYEYYYLCDENKQHVITDRAFQRFISFEVLPALRNASADLESWRRSPLSRMIERLDVNRDELRKLGEAIDDIVADILSIPAIQGLQDAITGRIEQMIGEIEPIDPLLGFLPTDPDRLLRFLRLFAEGIRQRNLDEIGTGYANIIYIVLLLLDAKQKQELVEQATMILAVEEPEAHLHPHLQRLVYGDLLTESNSDVPLLMTTHSPHIASVAPLRSLLLLSKSPHGTLGHNTFTSGLLDKEIRDIERYLDVTRAELVFSKGVILVEGVAEAMIINEFAKLKGASLDELGISIIRIEGTDFKPYIKLLGPNGFNIRTAVVTDGDPYENSGIPELDGINRGLVLFNLIHGEDRVEIIDNLTDDYIIACLCHDGIFVGNHTLETDMLDVGYHTEYLRVFRELGAGWTSIRNSKDVFRNWNKLDFKEKDQKVIQKIKRLGGKGRFAQRLAPRLKANKIPAYISYALDYMGIR